MMIKYLPILLILLTSCTHARVDRVPLYEDPSGWAIPVARSGLDISDPYIRARDRAREMGIGSPDIPGMIYISRDPLSIYGFIILIPQDKQLIWPIESSITIFYVEDGDTLSSTSVELFVCNKYPTPVGSLPGKVMSTNEMNGPFFIPNNWVFTTPNQDPVVFARFPFGKEPQNLLKVTVANVTVTDRR